MRGLGILSEDEVIEFYDFSPKVTFWYGLKTRLFV
jgi:hypothetical protein